MGDATFSLTPPNDERVAKAKQPPMYELVIEALRQNTTAKGMSLPAVKKQIVQAYPGIEEKFSQARFKKAITKGLECGDIVRPKTSEESGFNGYFKLNRLAFEKKGKDAKAKAAKKLQAKSPSKKRPLSPTKRAPKSPKKRDSSKDKMKATKSPGKMTKSPGKLMAPKSPKSPGKVKAAKSPKVKKAAKSPKEKKEPSRIKADKKPKKPKVPKSLAKSLATPVSTPKLSKSTAGGARSKTKAVKKSTKSKDQE